MNTYNYKKQVTSNMYELNSLVLIAHSFKVDHVIRYLKCFCLMHGLF